IHRQWHWSTRDGLRRITNQRLLRVAQTRRRPKKVQPPRDGAGLRMKAAAISNPLAAPISANPFKRMTGRRIVGGTPDSRAGCDRSYRLDDPPNGRFARAGFLDYASATHGSLRRD